MVSKFCSSDKIYFPPSIFSPNYLNVDSENRYKIYIYLLQLL